MYSAFAQRGCTLNILLGGWWKAKIDGRLLTTSSLFSFKIGEESIQIVLSPAWCSKLRLTTGVYLALYRDEFRELRSDTVRQVALATGK
ncbi:hypothetical protein TNCV_5096051 [Trichonephila clavipes]|nr:hypothetical protein TNCV_5096051 [Trichonephila clavipes]